MNPRRLAWSAPFPRQPTKTPEPWLGKTGKQHPFAYDGGDDRTLPKRLEEATDRLKDAALRIEAARAQAFIFDGVKQWLAALSDYAMALADVQSFNNESGHEKLHELAGCIGLRELPLGTESI
jgi:hypothetical protein